MGCVKQSKSETSMTRYLSTAVAAGALAFGVAHSSAVGISGSVAFAPTKTISVTPNLWSGVAAVTVDFKPGPNALVGDSSATTGDFLAILAAPPYAVTFLDFTTGGAAVPGFWSIGAIASFDLATSANISTDNLFLNITGTGTLHAAGYDDTPGYFNLQANRTDPTKQIEFYFTASTTTTPPVQTPDGGATAVLLGLALLSVGAITRRNA
jgi:hypothetical protein